MELKSDKQVKTFWAVKMWSVKTYVKKVTKVISTVELKKNDKNAPRTKASFRNQESSDLKANKQTIHGKSKANSRDKNIASLSIVVKKKRNRSCLVGQKKFSPSRTPRPRIGTQLPSSVATELGRDICTCCECKHIMYAAGISNIS